MQMAVTGECKPLMDPTDTDFASTLTNLRNDESATGDNCDENDSDWEEVGLDEDMKVKLEGDDVNMDDGQADIAALNIASVDEQMFLSKRGLPCRSKETKEYECDRCQDVFPSRHALLRHRKDHADIKLEDNFECDLCQKSFASTSLLKSHLKVKHSVMDKSKHKCRICGKVFPNSSRLDIHEQIHAGIRHSCDHCDKTFSSRNTLKFHTQLHTGGAVYCKICSRAFAYEYNLRMHMKVHSDTQEHVCDTCSAKFSRRVDLQRHMTIHTGERPYKCDVCGASYRLPGDLGRHRRKHEGTVERKRLSCPYCDKVYARTDELKQHVTKHETMMGLPVTYAQYRCDVCRKVLSNKITYDSHMLRHKQQPDDSGGGNFECQHCGESFSTSSNRNRHVRRKHEEPNITCDSCGKLFSTISDLKHHIKLTHLKLFPFPCSQCDRRFEKRNALQKHELRVHTIGCADF